MDKNRDTHFQIKKKMQRGILSSHISQTSNRLEAAVWRVGKHSWQGSASVPPCLGARVLVIVLISHFFFLLEKKEGYQVLTKLSEDSFPRGKPSALTSA